VFAAHLEMVFAFVERLLAPRGGHFVERPLLLPRPGVSSSRAPAIIVSTTARSIPQRTTAASARGKSTAASEEIGGQRFHSQRTTAAATRRSTRRTRSFAPAARPNRSVARTHAARPGQAGWPRGDDRPESRDPASHRQDSLREEKPPRALPPHRLRLHCSRGKEKRKAKEKPKEEATDENR